MLKETEYRLKGDRDSHKAGLKAPWALLFLGKERDPTN